MTTPRVTAALRRRLTAVVAVVAGGGAAALSLTTAAPSAVAATGTPTRTVQGIRVSPAFFGLHDGSMAAYGGLTVGSVRLWDAGVEWRQVETSPGVYDWSRLDSLVSAAQAHGTEVTLVLAMTPSFAGPAANLPPTDLAEYADYVGAVMTRYRDFNEPRDRGVPGVERGQCADLLGGFAARARPADPGRRRGARPGRPGGHGGRPLLRGPAGRAAALDQRVRVPDGRRQTRVALLRRQRAEPLPDGDVRRPPRRSRGRDAPARPGPRAARRRRGAGHQAGVGHGDQLRPEVGRTGPAQCRARGTGAAGGQRPAHLPARRLRGLDRIFWYRYDWGRLPESQGGGTLGNTLLTTPGQWNEVTPAGEALTTAEDWLSGRLVDAGARGSCARDRRGTFTCAVRYSGRTRTIYWNPQHRVTVQVRGAVSRQGQNGVSTRMSGRLSRVSVGFRPVAVVTR